jgi:hypothetical protein
LHQAVINTNIGALIILLSAFLNLGLLLLFENWYFQKSKKNAITYLISSYSLSLCDKLCGKKFFGVSPASIIS